MSNSAAQSNTNAPAGGEFDATKGIGSDLKFELFGKEVGFKAERGGDSTSVEASMNLGEIKIPEKDWNPKHRFDIPTPIPGVTGVVDVGISGGFKMGGAVTAKGTAKDDGSLELAVSGDVTMSAGVEGLLGAGIAAGIPRVAQLSATVEGIPKLEVQRSGGVKGTLKRDAAGNWSGSITFPTKLTGEISAEIRIAIKGMIDAGFLGEWEKNLATFSLGKWVVGTCGLEADVGVGFPGPTVTGSVVEPHFSWGKAPDAKEI